MHTLLLLLTAQAAAAGHPWGEPLPPHPTLSDRFVRCYRNFGMVVSGTACYYDRHGVPASSAPTPTYLFYFQEPPPRVIVPVTDPSADAAPKGK